MNPEILLDKLINNQISKEEFELLLEGIDDEDVRARYEIYLKEQFEKEVNESFSNQEEMISTLPHLTVTKSIKKAHRLDTKFSLTGKYPIAAILILFVGMLFSVFFIISQMGNNNYDLKNAHISMEPQLITKTTPKGRMFRMNLEDGSFVHMNAVSSITYPNSFDKNERDIELKGEAFFDIKRDETRPFSIKVKDFKVQVLGTSFNIQAYDDEDDFSVTVASGTVKVLLDKEGVNSAVLEKNQKLIYNPKTNVTEIVDVESDDELNWREGILRFESTPMAKVEKMLERWYGIDVVVANADIYNKTITGIHKNENLKSVIEALTYATGTKYQVKGNSIILKL